MTARAQYERDLWSYLLAHLSASQPDEMYLPDPSSRADQDRQEAAVANVQRALYLKATTRAERTKRRDARSTTTQGARSS